MGASTPEDKYRRPLIEGTAGHESQETILLLERSHGISGGRYRQENI